MELQVKAKTMTFLIRVTQKIGCPKVYYCLFSKIASFQPNFGEAILRKDFIFVMFLY